MSDSVNDDDDSVHYGHSRNKIVEKVKKRKMYVIIQVNKCTRNSADAEIARHVILR